MDVTTSTALDNFMLNQPWRKNDIILLNDVIYVGEHPQSYSFEINFASRVDWIPVATAVVENGRQQTSPKGILKRSPSAGPTRRQRSLSASSRISAAAAVVSPEPIDRSDLCQPDSFDKLQDMVEGEVRDVILRVGVYLPKPNNNLIFINCCTADNKKAVVVAPLVVHSEDMKPNDIVLFKSVKRNQMDKPEIRFRFTEESEAFLKVRNGKNLECPQKFLTGEQKMQQEPELWHDASEKFDAPVRSVSRKNSEVVLPDVPNDNLLNGYNLIPEDFRVLNGNSQAEILSGELQTDFEIKNEMGKTVYTADLLLNDKSTIMLVIDAGFGKWPANLLKTGHRVSVGGIESVSSGKRTREVFKGDIFDFDDLPPY
uniref:Uncharacterized protein n=1 Tax=Panagrolaimus sp. JU765 TaxID=591449 RepID=A0AC34REZ4_9BILA